MLASQAVESGRLDRLAWHFRIHRASSRRRFLFASCWPDEGKTSMVFELGRSLSVAGMKVLVVDGDRRRPTLSYKLEHRGAGLFEFLRDPEANPPLPVDENLHLLGASEVFRPPFPQEVERFEQATQKYDLVLVDSPPFAGCADALGLSQLCDAAVLVISRKRYQRRAAESMVKEFSQMGVPVEGLLLTHERGSSMTSRVPSDWWSRLAIWLGLRP